MEKELQEYLNFIIKRNFNNSAIIDPVNAVEELLIKNQSSYNPSLYFNALSIIGYYYAMTHHYDKSQYWLEKIPDHFSNSWNIFKKTLYPIFYMSQKEEREIIEKIKKNFDYINNLVELNIQNLSFLTYSFWYGYIDNNPKEIYQKYAQLQMKAFPSISSQNLISDPNFPLIKKKN